MKRADEQVAKAALRAYAKVKPEPVGLQPEQRIIFGSRHGVFLRWYTRELAEVRFDDDPAGYSHPIRGTRLEAEPDAVT